MKEQLERYAAVINRRLDGLMGAYNEENAGAQLICPEAMRYSLSAGGKRIRPVLCLEFARIFGAEEKALDAACALEMIHTYSLIHDDLPAMDNDDLRRGQLTNHRKFGEDVAILAGDGLLSAAMELMARQAAKLAKAGDCSGVLAMEAIARHAGVTGMVAGQTMDVTSEGTKPTADKVRYIHLHKTADLLTAPVEAGLLLAGATQEQVKYGCEYGQRLGMAFQMVDDLLDVIGTEEALGKSIGKDVAEEKLTWIAIRGIEGTREDAARETTLAVDAAAKIGGDMKFLQTLAQSTLNRVQ